MSCKKNDDLEKRIQMLERSIQSLAGIVNLQNKAIRNILGAMQCAFRTQEDLAAMSHEVSKTLALLAADSDVGNNGTAH